ILDRKDKTVFGEHLLTHADYELIGRYVIDPPHRFDGVDYARLAERIEQRDFTLWEFCWARDLTSVHAFLTQLGTTHRTAVRGSRSTATSASGSRALGSAATSCRWCRCWASRPAPTSPRSSTGRPSSAWSPGCTAAAASSPSGRTRSAGSGSRP